MKSVLRVWNLPSLCRRIYGTRRHYGATTQLNNESEDESEEIYRVPFKKSALYVIYCGSSTAETTKLIGVKNVSKHLLYALNKAEAITKENVEDVDYIKFELGSATDIGSSALGQVISTKMCQTNDIVDKLNKNLPPHIQVIGFKSVTGGFSSKFDSSGETFSYLIPSYAFAPINEVTSENYRLSGSVLDELRDVISMLTGKHHYHNFTINTKPLMAYAEVNVTEFQCSEPFFIENIEFVQLSITGNKLLTYQIRKMIAFTVAIMRSIINRFIIHKIWQNKLIDVPKAPSLGLCLEKINYEEYNTYCLKSREPRELMTGSPYKELVEKFRSEHIIPAIVYGEKTNHSTRKWLADLPDHIYDVTSVKSKLLPLSFIGLSKQLLENFSKVKKEENEDLSMIKG